MSRENNPLIVARDICEVLPNRDYNFMREVCAEILFIDEVHSLIPFKIDESMCRMRIKFLNDVVTNDSHFMSEEKIEIDFTSGEDLVFSLYEAYQASKIDNLVMPFINQKLEGETRIPEIEYLVKLAHKYRNILLRMFLSTAGIYNNYRRKEK